jgi:hypothetical protein
MRCRTDARVVPKRAVAREFDCLDDDARRRRKQDGVEEIDRGDVPNREKAAEADRVARKPGNRALHPVPLLRALHGDGDLVTDHGMHLAVDATKRS